MVLDVQTVSLIGEMKLSDFEMIKIIGRGTYGMVYLVKCLKNGKLYAMKIVKKRQLRDEEVLEYTISERDIMRLKHPFIVYLHYAFQRSEKLYFIMNYCEGKELYEHLFEYDSSFAKKRVLFSEEKARFYAAELICALQHLHDNKIIYRDIKPENIFLQGDGHIQLGDFGLSKILKNKSDKASTICGSPEFIAPEIIAGKKYTNLVDNWGLGLLIYELVADKNPHRNDLPQH